MNPWALLKMMNFKLIITLFANAFHQNLLTLKQNSSFLYKLVTKEINPMPVAFLFKFILH